MEASDNLVDTFNRLIGNSTNIHELGPLTGLYRLYRPCFRKPKEQILASLFTVGVGGDASDCEMQTLVCDEFDEFEEETVTGKIAPTLTDAMCVLTAPKARSRFIIHFDEIARSNNSEGSVRFMTGVLLAAPGDRRSSAWPVFAQPVSEGEDGYIEPSIIPGEDFPDLPQIIRETLSRGIVHANKEFSPGPPIRKSILRLGL